MLLCDIVCALGLDQVRPVRTRNRAGGWLPVPGDFFGNRKYSVARSSVALACATSSWPFCWSSWTEALVVVVKPALAWARPPLVSCTAAARSLFSRTARSWSLCTWAPRSTRKRWTGAEIFGDDGGLREWREDGIAGDVFGERPLRDFFCLHGDFRRGRCLPGLLAAGGKAEAGEHECGGDAVGCKGLMGSRQVSCQRLQICKGLSSK